MAYNAQHCSVWWLRPDLSNQNSLQFYLHVWLLQLHYAIGLCLSTGKHDRS